MSTRGNHNKVLAWAIIAGVLGLASSLSAFKVRNVDIHWHMKTGEWIVEHKSVPTADFFSFSREGEKWLDAQWLFQVICWEAYSRLGERALTAFTMAMTASMVLLLAFAFPGRLPINFRGLLGILFLAAINPRIICRPEHLTCLYMAAAFIVLERSRRGNTRLLLLVPIIQLLWANSEGLWPIGLGMMGAYIGDLFLEARRRPGFSYLRPVPATWLITMVAVILVNLVQPYGLDGFLFPLRLLWQVMSASTVQKQLVADIQPLFAQPVIWPSAVPFLFFCAMSLIITLACTKRIRVFIFLSGLIFFYLAVTARRNLGVAGIVIMHMAMTHMEILVEKWPRWLLSPKLTRITSVVALAASVCLALLAQVQPVRTWDHTARERGFGFSETQYATEAVAFLKSIEYRGKIINNDRVGGYLIWAGWPDWMVFADPRMELGGEKALEQRMYVFMDMGTFRYVARINEVEAVVIDLWEEGLARFASKLDSDLDWALVFINKESGHAVFLKRTPRLKTVIEKNEIKH